MSPLAPIERAWCGWCRDHAEVTSCDVLAANLSRWTVLSCGHRAVETWEPLAEDTGEWQRNVYWFGPGVPAGMGTRTQSNEIRT